MSPVAFVLPFTGTWPLFHVVMILAALAGARAFRDS